MKLLRYLACFLAIDARGVNQGPIDTGLFYDEYLKAVITILEKDEDLREKMEAGDLSHLKISELTDFDEINELAQHLRDELDDLKRTEVERIRKLLKAQSRLNQGKKVNVEALVNDVAGHIDPENVENFSLKDLNRLIKSVAADMGNFDAKRHQQFKEYEMHKAMEREDKLEQMNAYEKAEFEKEEKKRIQRHMENAKIPHPFSRDFLEDVWSTFDHLKGETFSPKTFFLLHDINGDGFIDAYELEAIFQPELDRIWDPKNPNEDMREMEEERSNMREHVMHEVDTNRDTAISLGEFTTYTQSKEFERPSNDYVMIDEQIARGELYTAIELTEYRQKVKEHESILNSKLEWLKREAVDLAKKRKDFIVLKQKADEINDPHVHAAVKKTEGDLNQRHLHMMGAHNDIDKHQKESLDMQGQLGHKQITAHIVNGTDFSGMSQDEIDLYKNRYEELQQEMEAMLADKEKQYQAEVEAAKKHMLEASEYVAAKMKEKHQAMFKEMMKERVHTTNELVKGKKKQAEMEKRDAEEAAEL